MWFSMPHSSIIILLIVYLKPRFFASAASWAIPCPQVHFDEVIAGRRIMELCMHCTLFFLQVLKTRHRLYGNLLLLWLSSEQCGGLLVDGWIRA